MTKREIRKKFRAQDESHLWPVCGRFNVTERAIRKVREQERVNGSLSEEEYELALDRMISLIVNKAV